MNLVSTEDAIRAGIDFLCHKFCKLGQAVPEKDDLVCLIMQLDALASKYLFFNRLSPEDKFEFYQLNTMMNKIQTNAVNAIVQMYDICWETCKCTISRDVFWRHVEMAWTDQGSLCAFKQTFDRIHTAYTGLLQEDGALIQSSLQFNDVFEEFSGLNANLVDLVRRIQLSDIAASDLIPLNPENAWPSVGSRRQGTPTPTQLHSSSSTPLPADAAGNTFSVRDARFQDNMAWRGAGFQVFDQHPSAKQRFVVQTSAGQASFTSAQACQRFILQSSTRYLIGIRPINIVNLQLQPLMGECGRESEEQRFARKGKQFLPEHSRRLSELMEEKGKSSFSNIAALLNAEFGTSFDGKSCQQHWQRVCKPDLHKGRWSVDDDSQLLRLYGEYQNNYKKIAHEMSTRSVAQVRNRLVILTKGLAGQNDAQPQ